MAKISGILIKEAKRGQIRELNSVVVTRENGLHGDFRGHGGSGRKRQVTLLSLLQWRAVCKDLGVELPWQTRRANLLIDGMCFFPEDLGGILSFGEVALEITGETAPCSRMDEAHPGLKDALSEEWFGGVTCRVIYGGTISVGDRIRYL